MTPSASQIAKSWLTKWSMPDPATGVDEFDLDFDVPRDHPDLCFEAVIQALLLISPDDHRMIGLLAAGPLEELLDQHGTYVISRVEAQAASDPAFAFLLGGVWRADISDAVWVRIQAVWDRRGWDREPSERLE